MIALLVLGLGFDFVNGMNDSSNIVATTISSRALPPRTILMIVAVAEFAGPFIFGVRVARTIGGGIVNPGAITLTAVIATLSSAIIWGLFTSLSGIPSSGSHAVIGGLIGAVVASSGWGMINSAGIIKVLIILFISPMVGFLVGLTVAWVMTLACWNSTPRVNRFFREGQIATSIALALSYGANDGQKTMGIITLGLFTSGYITQFDVPVWVILLCASMIAIGTSVGGWNLIRTLGAKFYRIRPMDGFSTQLASAIVILTASLFGGLVSTTQVVSASIMGVGSAERVNKVRWGVVKEIALAWLLTIPATGLIGAGFYWMINNFIVH
jgi:Phosphate/sulphate permeases